jgi:hypothetical protein
MWARDEDMEEILFERPRRHGQTTEYPEILNKNILLQSHLFTGIQKLICN